MKLVSKSLLVGHVVIVKCDYNNLQACECVVTEKETEKRLM